MYGATPIFRVKTFMSDLLFNQFFFLLDLIHDIEFMKNCLKCSLSMNNKVCLYYDSVDI